MSTIQPDLFGGSAIVGASSSVRRVEAAQCVGQTDVFSQLADCAGSHDPHPCCSGCAAVCGEPCHWACLSGHGSALDGDTL